MKRQGQRHKNQPHLGSSTDQTGGRLYEDREAEEGSGPGCWLTGSVSLDDGLLVYKEES